MTEWRKSTRSITDAQVTASGALTLQLRRRVCKVVAKIADGPAVRPYLGKRLKWRNILKGGFAWDSLRA
jgi:hypothetical protein